MKKINWALVIVAITAMLVGEVYASPAASHRLTELETGMSEEVGMYTVTNEGHNIWHIEDCTTENPHGAQIDHTGNFVGMNNSSDMYVVLGDQKALLVDLSNQFETGYEDIVHIFDALANGREQEVWITHAHPDHVGQFPAFREAGYTIYIEEHDYDGLDEFIPLGMDKTLVTPFSADGVLDLGGRQLYCVHVPGHTDGSNVLYEAETSIGFSGDSVGSGMGSWLMGSFDEFEHGLNALLDVIDNQMDGEITLMSGHTWQKGTDSESEDYVTMDRQYVADMLSLIEHIKTGDRYEISHVNFGHGLDTNLNYGKAIITMNGAKTVQFALEHDANIGWFGDVQGEKLTKAVNQLYAAGLTAGVSNTQFQPERTITRAEFITMLGRFCGAEVDQAAECGFSDVVRDGWSYGYIVWAIENGLADGGDDGIFGQYQPMTQEQVNLLLERYNSVFETQINGYSAPVGNASRGSIAILLASELPELK